MNFSKEGCTFTRWKLSKKAMEISGSYCKFLKEGFRSRKRLFTIFFNSQGPVCVCVCECNASTVYYHIPVLHWPSPSLSLGTSGQVCTNPTPIVPFAAPRQCCPHKVRLTEQFLKQQGITLLPHPPYSPDLASCDFLLFPKIKGAIVGKLFHRIQDLARAANSELWGIPASEYRDCFMKWLRRMERYIEAGGDYFEGL